MNNNTFIHKYLSGIIKSDDIVVDATTGSGNDTLFLCQKAKKVIGFDIQDEALKKTEERCKDYHNLILIKDNHRNLNKYIKEKVKLFIFNLGYFPLGDHSIVTKKEDTLESFIKAYNLLLDDGYIVISFYRGHPGGKDEYYYLCDYLEKNNINVLEKYRQYKSLDEPITYIIRKRP